MAPAVGLLVARAVDTLATLGILLLSPRLPTVESDALTIRTMMFSVIGVASLAHGASKMFDLRSYRICNGGWRPRSFSALPYS